MKFVYIVHIETESSDHYYEAYSYKPEQEDIIKRLWEDEGKCEDLSWYLDTTSVTIKKLEVINEIRR
jgi:hypothetical protein